MRKIVYCLILGLVLCGMAAKAYSDERVAALKEQIIDIQNAGNLGVRNFTLCSNIIGFGQYVSAGSSTITAGKKALFYYEPVNVFTNRRGGTYQIWYTQDIVLCDDAGKELFRRDELLTFNYQTLSPVLDMYATNSIDMNIPPGTYIYRIILHDKLKNADSTYDFALKVVE